MEGDELTDEQRRIFRTTKTVRRDPTQDSKDALASNAPAAAAAMDDLGEQLNRRLTNYADKLNALAEKKKPKGWLAKFIR